jgi:hypothetical protein
MRLLLAVIRAGRPIILLHGGMNAIRSSFEKQIQVFAKTQRVIAIEQMAHGLRPTSKAAR